MSSAHALRLALIAALAVVAIVLSLVMLERGRSGVVMVEQTIGTTPATLFRQPSATGPVVIIAHGFAGSRQMMHSYALTLAQSGYAVLAFDTEGHGRNPVPMSGDVTRIDGTTALLVAEVQRVIAAGRALPGGEAGVALLGHSMATDVIIRAAQTEEAAGRKVTAVVAISMFSQAVTAQSPARLLVISGEWEGMLRGFALDALRQVQPSAAENQTATNAAVTRRAVVAPKVEHVGVLFSATALREARTWLDAAFGRTSPPDLVQTGPWLLVLLAGVVALFAPLAHLLPKTTLPMPEVSAPRFLAAVLGPAVLVPLVATPLYTRFLPVLVADYLLVHLALLGGLQLLILRVWHLPVARPSMVAIAALLVWGIGVFGVALDRYGASFWPTGDRGLIIAALAFGTVPFLLADSFVTGAGRGPFWRRCLARVAVLASLGGAAALDPDRLMFLFIILPVVLLFFLVYGLMGRWVARRCGPLSAGVGLGLVLAWTLGVSFPLFASG